jgi:signal transduction histidine kinase
VLAELRKWAAAGGSYEREALHLRKDGSSVRVHMRIIPMADEHGRLRCAMTIVRELSADSRVDRLRDEFVSLVSSSLKSPLTAILGFTQLLQRPEVADDPRRRARVIEAVDGHADRLRSLVDDLLLVSRIQTGALLLEPKAVDLTELTATCIGDFEEVHPRRRFVLDVEGRMPTVRADRGRLALALTHLLDNAHSYSPLGEEICVSVVRDGGDALVSVTDRGPGIEADELGRVFERFFRGATAVGQGVGMGLYLARMVAEAHGGGVTAISSVGEGSTFTLRLPLGAAH